MPFSLFLALKYLKPKRSVTSVITCVSVLGVLLGVAVVIIVRAVMTGFGDLWQEKILDFKPHVTLRSQGPGPVIRGEEALAEAIAAVPGVTAVSPEINTPVMLQWRGRIATPVVLGVDPDRDFRRLDLAVIGVARLRERHFGRDRPGGDLEGRVRAAGPLVHAGDRCGGGARARVVCVRDRVVRAWGKRPLAHAHRRGRLDGRSRVRRVSHAFDCQIAMPLHVPTRTRAVVVGQRVVARRRIAEVRQLPLGDRQLSFVGNLRFRSELDFAQCIAVAEHPVLAFLRGLEARNVEALQVRAVFEHVTQVSDFGGIEPRYIEIS